MALAALLKAEENLPSTLIVGRAEIGDGECKVTVPDGWAGFPVLCIRLGGYRV